MHQSFFRTCRITCSVIPPAVLPSVRGIVVVVVVVMVVVMPISPAAGATGWRHGRQSGVAVARAEAVVAAAAVVVQRVHMGVGGGGDGVLGNREIVQNDVFGKMSFSISYLVVWLPRCRHKWLRSRDLEHQGRGGGRLLLLSQPRVLEALVNGKALPGGTRGI